MDTKDIAAHFRQLSGEDQRKLLWELELINMEKEVDEATVLEQVKSNKPSLCPNCNASSIVSNGTLNGVRRFKCKSCCKNFSETTGSTIAWIKKRMKFKQYVNHS